MAKTKRDPQGGLFDRTIEDEEFEGFLNDRMANVEGHKAFVTANRGVAQKCEYYGLQDGERLRVGAYVITGGERAGGGFEVPAWGPKVIAAKVEET